MVWQDGGPGTGWGCCGESSLGGNRVLNDPGEVPGNMAGQGRTKAQVLQSLQGKTSDYLGITWHSTAWHLSLHLSSLKWVLGGMGKRLVG